MTSQVYTVIINLCERSKWRYKKRNRPAVPFLAQIQEPVEEYLLSIIVSMMYMRPFARTGGCFLVRYPDFDDSSASVCRLVTLVSVEMSRPPIEATVEFQACNGATPARCIHCHAHLCRVSLFWPQTFHDTYSVC